MDKRYYICVQSSVYPPNYTPDFNANTQHIFGSIRKQYNNQINKTNDDNY